MAQFIQRSLEFGYGMGAPVIGDGRIAAVQAISGTGGCRLAGEFIHKFFGKVPLFIPNPTWGNHVAIFQNAGLVPTYYPYYDAAKNSVDFEALKKSMTEAPNGSWYLLHACAHNPTGCDLTKAQWDELSVLMKHKQHHALFDSAYQVSCVH